MSCHPSPSERLLQVIWTFIVRYFMPRHNAQLQFLRAQVRILRSRIDAERIVPTPEERAELLRLGAACGHEVRPVLEIVQWRTYRHWLREKCRGREHRPSGRPGIVAKTRKLVARMAGENGRWGYRRIAGELKKLGIEISAMSVKRILREAGISPEPEKARKQPPIPWTDFIHAHIDSFVACDFFTKSVWSLRGRCEAYVLVFIALGSREVFTSPPTLHPTHDWVKTQMRSASAWLLDIGVEARYLVRDGDQKYPTQWLREFWESEGVRVIRTPPYAPQANAFCESFIGTLKRECLNHFICFGMDHLHYIVRTWVKHYNTERPHRGIGKNNEVLDENFKVQTIGEVRCKTQLGGVIKSYYRDAA